MRCSTRLNERIFRAGAGVAVLDLCLYAIGGFDDNAPLDSCERYDPRTDKWEMIPKMSCPRGNLLLEPRKRRSNAVLLLIYINLHNILEAGSVLEQWADEYMRSVGMMAFDISIR